MSSSKSLLRPLSKSVYYLSAPSAPSSSLSTSPSSSGSSSPPPPPRDDPSLVIAFGWMDAQLKHVEKYLTTYRKLFPNSPILLLQSSQKGFYSTQNMIETKKAFAPAIEIIRQNQQRHLDEQEKKSGMLVHVFSNGGCMSLKWLNQELGGGGGGGSKTTISQNEEKTPLLSSSTSTTSTAPAPLEGTRAVIFDSCPGKSSLLVTMRAFSAPIRSKYLRIPAMGFLAILHGLISLYNLILRKPPILNRLYSYLNLPTSLPRVPRLYLYSKLDELIPYKDVEAHADEAETKLGVKVRKERFEKTSHVGHVRGDPERYWSAIEEVWRESRK
ncbi:uncharacterized protein JCM6883_003884 [Sporobolomyces salmoneus]|uniref:uncharacterized protein n=1 Tax=Sporobolomyces salmoneus TaxID=183962 RepID=UPI003176E128